MLDTRTIENRIAKKTIATLLAAGYELSVNDGEETTLERSTDAAAIFAAMMTTDEDYLIVSLPSASERFGWIRFVYGNDGPDVICDNTTNLEADLEPVTAYAEGFEE